MATGNKDVREAKRRVAAMEAREELRTASVRRRKRDNVVAAAAIVLVVALAVVLQLTVFIHNPTAEQVAAAESGLNASASADSSASPSATAPHTNAANIPQAATAAGKTFTGTLSLNHQNVGVRLDGTKAPQAVAVFKSLADSGFFAGKTCHRLTTGDNFGVLQCGSLNGDGNGDPSYQWGPVENSPQDGKYPAGSIAVARGSDVNSNGTQFFICYKDTVLPQTTGGYTLMGTVTSGLDVLTTIAAAGVQGGGTDGKPVTGVTIDSFTLK